MAQRILQIPDLGNFSLPEEEARFGCIRNFWNMPNEWAIKYLGVGPGVAFTTTSQSEQGYGQKCNEWWKCWAVTVR